MRVLTLIQPWAFAVAYLGKRLENRGWEPRPGDLRPGDRFAIHAGKKFDPDAAESILLDARCHICGGAPSCLGRYEDMKVEEIACDDCCGHGCEDGYCEPLVDLLLAEKQVHGAVVAVAKLERCVRTGDLPLFDGDRKRALSGYGVDLAQVQWACGPVLWVLADVIALPKPVPCKGAQGLWALPEAVEREVVEQLIDAAEAEAR